MSKIKSKIRSEDIDWAKNTVKLWNLSDEKWEKNCFKYGPDTHRFGLACYHHQLVRNGKKNWTDAYKEGKIVLGYEKQL